MDQEEENNGLFRTAKILATAAVVAAGVTVLNATLVAVVWVVVGWII